MDSQKNSYILEGYKVLKYHSLGTLIWNKTYSYRYTSINIDAADNMYLSGDQSNGNYILSEHAALKTDTQGNILYQMPPLAGNREFYPSFSKVISAGELYVFGTMAENAPQRVYLHLTKYNASGTVAWSMDVSGNDSSGNNTVTPVGLDIDATGNVIIIADAQSISVPNFHFCMLKVNPNGTILWRKDYLPTSGQNANITGFELDSYGDLWIGEQQGDVYRFNWQTGNLMSSFSFGSNIFNVSSIKRYKKKRIINGGEFNSSIHVTY